MAEGSITGFAAVSLRKWRGPRLDYAATLSRDLLGTWSLRLEWSMPSHAGRKLSQSFESESHARRALRAVERRRATRGYVLVYSFDSCRS